MKTKTSVHMTGISFCALILEYVFFERCIMVFCVKCPILGLKTLHQFFQEFTVISYNIFFSLYGYLFELIFLF